MQLPSFSLIDTSLIRFFGFLSFPLPSYIYALLDSTSLKQQIDQLTSELETSQSNLSQLTQERNIDTQTIESLQLEINTWKEKSEQHGNHLVQQLQQEREMVTL